MTDEQNQGGARPGRVTDAELAALMAPFIDALILGAREDIETALGPIRERLAEIERRLARLERGAE